MILMKKEIHIMKNRNGGWFLKQDGKIIFNSKTKQIAINHAIHLSKLQKNIEIIIHSRNEEVVYEDKRYESEFM